MYNIDLQTPLLELSNYLLEKSWIVADEELLRLEKPGEGNMNVVVRVITNQRSFILKQARPFVQKYPTVQAPLERIESEYRFYKAISQNGPLGFVPRILAYDKRDYLLMLTDLGSCNDLSSLYKKNSVDSSDIDTLVGFLKKIHSTPPPNDYPLNKGLRELNHQHLFILPFLENNGFNLDQVQVGLEMLSIPIKKNKSLDKVILELGKLYLSDNGKVLLHGDYYPGSWIRNNDNLYVIDPEFSFVGFAEYDLGVMAGHLMLVTLQKEIPDKLSLLYGDDIDQKLVRQVAGMEIIRRLLGLAQLPLLKSLDEKEALLDNAQEMLLE